MGTALYPLSSLSLSSSPSHSPGRKEEFSLLLDARRNPGGSSHLHHSGSFPLLLFSLSDRPGGRAGGGDLASSSACACLPPSACRHLHLPLPMPTSLCCMSFTCHPNLPASATMYTCLCYATAMLLPCPTCSPCPSLLPHGRQGQVGQWDMFHFSPAGGGRWLEGREGRRRSLTLLPSH